MAAYVAPNLCVLDVQVTHTVTGDDFWTLRWQQKPKGQNPCDFQRQFEMWTHDTAVHFVSVQIKWAPAESGMRKGN